METKNTYHKYLPNVFLAKCTEKHEKGETIQLTTKYGKQNDCIVFNLVGQKEGFYYYDAEIDYNAEHFEKYLMDWRKCESVLEHSVYKLIKS